MKKDSKPIFIMTICIFIVIGIFSAVSIYSYQSVPMIDVSELPFGIAWGTAKPEAENMMSTQGHEKYDADVEYTQTTTYTLRNYQNMEGVNGYAILNFDESLGFDEAILDFRSADTANGMCAEGKVDQLYKSLKKSLNDGYETAPYNALEGYEYWQGENVFVTVYYQKQNQITIAYSSSDNIAERAAE